MEYLAGVEFLFPLVKASSLEGRGIACTMDMIVFIMFGSVLCTMTALSFMELRRIRKKLESKPKS